MVASGWPVATWSPGFAVITNPTDGSTSSSTRVRPPPMAMIPCPTGSGAPPRPAPGAGGVDGRMRRLRQERWVVRHGRVATLRLDDLRQLPSAAPEAIVPCSRARAASRSRSRPAASSTSAPSAKVTSMRSAGPSPRSARIALLHLQRVAAGVAEGPVHGRHQRHRRTPLASPRAIMVRASSRACAVSGRNAPLPVFTSSTSAFEPLGQLLRHDAGRDQRNRRDGAGDVPQRIEPPVGRRDLRRLAEACAQPMRSHLRRRASRSESCVRKPGNGLQLVERAAGVAEAPARHHRHGDAAAGEHRARAGARSCRRRRRWSACRPAVRPSRRSGAGRPRRAWRRSARPARRARARARPPPSAARTSGSRAPRPAA